MLRKIFRFCAEAILERRNQNFDWAKHSYQFDDMTLDEMYQNMPLDAAVSLRDFNRIHKSLCSRFDFRYSDEDAYEYLQPFFKNLQSALYDVEIECYVAKDEEPETDGRVLVSDLIQLIQGLAEDLPDGSSDVNVREETYELVDEPEFDKGVLGEFQKKISQTLPLRTPSVAVEKVFVETDTPLNVLRPLVLATAMAARHCNCLEAIEKHNIPTLYENIGAHKHRKFNRTRSKRVYRGQEY